VLGARNGSSRSDADPDLPLEASGRRIRGPDGYNRHVSTTKYVPGNGQRWRWDDVAVGLDVRELEKKLVCDGQTHRASVVSRADEDNSWLAATRQIVGERTDGLTHLGRGIALERLLAFSEVGLDVGEHALQVLIAIGGHTSF